MKASFSNYKKIIDSIKKYHPITELEIKNIEKIVNFLISYSAEPDYSEDGILINFVEHSLAVAQYMASWRFDYSTVVAALLHEVKKNNHNINKEIAELINDSITETLLAYKNLHTQLELLKAPSDIKKEDTKIFDLCDSKPESLYIEIANNVDILYRNKDNNSEAVILYAQKTREIFIPQVMKINAFKMVNILEELCFQIENKDAFGNVSLIIKKLDRTNNYYRDQFMKRLCHIFDRNNNTVPEKLKTIQPYIKSFNVERRSTISIYRFITQNDPNYKNNSSLQNDLGKLKDLSRTAYYDLKLVLDDNPITENNYTPVDVFLKYYEELLRPNGVFLYGYYNTTKKDSSYFLLSDDMKNMYRFFVMTEKQYMHYLYGDVISPEKINLNYLSEKNETKIKVFRKDGSSDFVDVGATVLDFAFKIHEDVGLRFSYAILNKNSRFLPPHTILNNGDKVEIITCNNVTAEFNWFRYVNTDLAKNCLIKYFKAHYKKKE